MSPSPRTARAPGAVSLTLAALACSSPPPPTIPGRDVVGPPREAATLCSPPTSRFAQAWFQVTDLETGVSCPAFVEQDECVVSIFRDCTDRTARPPRSWLGQIDHDMKVFLARSDETAGGTDPYPPIDCVGPLAKDEREPPWVKLGCRRKANDPPHRGLYLEARETPGGPSFGRVGTLERTITVATPGAGREPFVTDFQLLPMAGELWAVVAGGADGTAGLYVGRADATRLDKLAAPALGAPTLLRVTDDERWALIAEGAQLHRLDGRTRAPSAPLLMAGPILALEVLPDGILVAALVETSTRAEETRLTLYDASDAATVRLEASVPGRVTHLVPLPVPAVDGAAALAFAGRAEAVVLDRSLRPSRTVPLGVAPAALALAPERLTLLAVGGAPPRLRATSLVEDAAPAYELLYPGAESLRAVAWDPSTRRALAADAGGITPIDLDGARPVLQGRVDAADPITAVRVDAATGTVYALRGPSGVIDVLRR